MNRKYLLKVLYVLSMAIAFVPHIGDIEVDHKVPLLIGMGWVLFFIIQLCINKFRFKGTNGQDVKWLIKIYVFPQIAIHMYSIVLMLIGKMDRAYFSSNISVYVPILLAIASLYLFDEQAFKLNAISIFLAWGVSVAICLLVKGPAVLWHSIIQAYIDPMYTLPGFERNYLEMHDVVLAIGYILVLYMIPITKFTKKNFVFLFVSTTIMFLGMKRISILGIILAIAFYYIVNRMKSRVKMAFCYLSATVAYLACYLFIYVLSLGDSFFEFVEKLGINVMGRNYYYKAVMDLAEFSPTFLGTGRNSIAKILTDELAYLRVGGVHSDIIKMYVENGFVLFGLWLFYYLFYVLRKYKTRFGSGAAVVYFTTIIYTFILYLTDNTEVYFICNIMAIVIPASYAIKNKNKNKNKNRISDSH